MSSTTAVYSQYLRFGYDHKLLLIPIRFPLTTLREFTMLHIMNELTDKPNWYTKASYEYIMQLGSRVTRPA
jgi:hypothetical protein